MAHPIQTTFHPEFKASLIDWEKFRFTHQGGRRFIERFLVKYTTKEGEAEFRRRRSLSYSPSYAKATVNDVQNSLFQRFTDIDRFDGPESYQEAVNGLNDGVDLQGNTMNGFIGRDVLPELLVLSKVGIYVDRANLNPQSLVANSRNSSPYLYIYKAEDIRSWTIDANGILTAVLLHDNFLDIDETTGLVSDQRERFRLLKLTDEGVEVTIFNFNLENAVFSGKEEYLLEGFDRIPFVISEISQSLLTDIADHQIALLNLASSDLGYSLNANFPFYVEQEDPAAVYADLLKSDPSSDGTSANGSVAKDRAVETGSTHGRSYPRGVEAPHFINPSAEPLLASMKKQEEITIQIRQLVNLAVSSLMPVRASADSKEKDNRGLESGLAYIGLELEYLERQIAIIWSMYEGTNDIASVKYPTQYSLKNDADRRTEAKEILELAGKVPSLTYQKESAKKAVILVSTSSAPAEKVQKMLDEIEAAEVIVIDSDILKTDKENGLVDADTASRARLYPPGSAEKARKDKIENVTAMAIAQSKAVDPDSLKPERGNKDAIVTGEETSNEKTLSQDADITGSEQNKTRGDA